MESDLGLNLPKDLSEPPSPSLSLSNQDSNSFLLELLQEFGGKYVSPEHNPGPRRGSSQYVHMCICARIRRRMHSRPKGRFLLEIRQGSGGGVST